MATQKRFTSTAIKVYSQSNTTYVVSFDTLEEAIAHVKNEKVLHPRSKKFNPMVRDTQAEKVNKYFNALYL
jgi:hypothetical protein